MFKIILPVLLILSILTGQIIKIPVTFLNGVTILDITIFFLCVIGLINLKFRLQKPPKYILSGLFFIIICIISLIFSPLGLTLDAYLISFSYTIRLFFYILFGWILYSGGLSAIKNNTQNILIYSGVGLAILGLLQFIFLPNLGFLESNGWDPHFFRNASTFLDPNFAGVFFVLTLILLVSSRGVIDEVIYQIRLPQPRLMAGFAMTIVYIALLTTFSRSAYLMFLVSGLIFSVLKKSKLFFFSTLLLFLLLLLSFQTYSQAVAKPRNINRSASATSRLNTWQQGFTLVEKYPILGVGYNSYRFAIKQFNLSDSSDSRGASSNDSSLLFVTSTTGVVGLLSFLYFLYTLILSGWKSWKNGNSYGLILISAVVGLVINSFFNNTLFYPFIFIWIILIANETVQKK